MNIKLHPIARIAELNRDEYLEFRRQGIGASDIAGVMSLSPWETPLSVYVNKVERVDNETSLQAELGLELEPFMRRKFAQRLKEEGILFNPMEQYMYKHYKYPFIRATPDDMFTHPEEGVVGVEYKTAGEFQRDQWSEDEIPTHYYLQVQGGMYVTGCSKWYLPYLIGNRRFDVLEIPRNEKIIADIEDACIKFWNDHVIPKIPPAPTGKDSDMDSLKMIYSDPEGETELFELEKTYDRLKRYEAGTKKLNEKILQLKQQIMFEMGNSEVAYLGFKDDGKLKKATWKMTNDAVVKEYVRKGQRQFRTN